MAALNRCDLVDALLVPSALERCRQPQIEQLLGLLAIDRENEAHNTRCAAEAGVGAPFVAYLPEQDALVLEFLDGTS